MKFMKLGSKPDIFQSDGNVINATTELSSDAIFQVGDTTFHLHKFPLLSKCGRIQRLVAEARGGKLDEFQLHDIPGGAESFELCAKFCYGIIFTLNAFFVMRVRCAAEYLEMTEVIEKGNLIFKLEVFLNSGVFRSWKDTVISLQSTKVLLPWSEDLKLVSRCIDSIASKTSVDPSKVDWSFTYARVNQLSEQFSPDSTSPLWNGIQTRQNRPVPKDWWVEDICELEVDQYRRVMLAIKSKGRMSHELVGEALRFYAHKWLQGVSKDQNLIETVQDGSGPPSDDYIETAAKHRLLLETIVSLLPSERGSSSCSFLFRLLKAATVLGAAPSSKMELARRIGLQLEEASLNHLLIPSLSHADDPLYDVDLVQRIVEHFMMQEQSTPTSPSREEQPCERGGTRSAEHMDLMENRRSTSSTQSSKLKVAKLIDGYLAEIARDKNLSLAKFVALAESIPKFARPAHDGLYRAIDIYLKEHPGLTKSERKRICRLMDCKKLSMDACIHAAQNDRLPLRVVVQVLFFEQMRTAMTGGFLLNDLPSHIKALLPRDASSQESGGQAVLLEDEWEVVRHDFKALKGDLANMKLRMAEAERERTSMRSEVVKHTRSRVVFSNPRKMFSKLWLSTTRNRLGGRGSEASGSSESSVSYNQAAAMEAAVEKQQLQPSLSTRRGRISIS